METITNPFEALDRRLQTIEANQERLLSALTHTGKNQSERKLYYSIRESALKLQVSEITIYRQVKTGAIPSKRIGSRRMIPADFIEKS